jgi:hypothetical protein
VNKFFIFLFSVFILTSLNSSAAVYKGQMIFAKKCGECHKDCQQFVASKNKISWKKLMQKNGEKLANLHIKSKDQKAKKSVKYFKSKRYKKKAKHLKQFLLEYAKDSGKVPACN